MKDSFEVFFSKSDTSMSDYGDGSDEDYAYDSNDEDSFENGDDYGHQDSFPEDLMCTDTKDQLSNKAVPYRILDYCAVEETMKSIIGNVASMLDVEFDFAQLLLVNNRWDDEKLIESYFNNPEKICIESGVDHLEVPSVRAKLNSRDSVKPFLCKVCYDDASSDGFSLGCGHSFCTGCYQGYLHNQVSEGPLCVVARCPEYKCSQAIPPTVVETFLNEEDKNLYKRYTVRQFIEANKSYRYCPAPNCELVSQGCGETNVSCKCGHEYCFHCAEEDHRPCNCSTLAKWIDKCNNDSETANWMAVNTKPCPKCVSRIEKNQGCNHMTCRQCKHEFCWICMGDWRGHSSCNRFTATGQDGVEDSVAKKKLNLERYMHYYKRHQNHDIALKFAEKQRSKTDAQLRTMQEQDCLVQQDVQVIKEAAEQVISCRRVLKYTYVIGYYMDENAPNKQLFERHQEMLEGNTEHLQELIETKNLKILDRTMLINYTRITEKFRNSLLDDIHDEAALEHGKADSPAAKTPAGPNSSVGNTIFQLSRFLTGSRPSTAPASAAAAAPVSTIDASVGMQTRSRATQR